MAQERLITPKELAYEWRQSVETVRRKCADGAIPSFRLGTGPKAPIRIDRAELEAQLHKPKGVT